MIPNLSAYFLPYQIDYLRNQSRLKIVKKSRRVGMTYTQSYEDVLDAARKAKPIDVWFSSADQTAALEYIMYCKQWVKLLNAAAEDLGEIVIDKDKDIKTYSIQFASGKRINALSSNPGQFRSKGGKVVLDEFAKHAQQDELWAAAQPAATWGFPVRVISTYMGCGNRYYRMVQDAQQPNSKWALHSIPIDKAVDQGLADKILGRSLTPQERQDWLDEVREMAGDEETWQQEYMCNPVDEATSWLTWDLIVSAEHQGAGQPDRYTGGDCYIGMDIARRRDLTVIWVVEAIGDILWTREVVSLKGATFAEQEDKLASLMQRYQVRRLCMDQTGIGEAPTERAKATYGSRVEGVLFTNSSKQTLATDLKHYFEDRRLRIPADKAIRDSHHSVRKQTTVSGNPRFDADRSEVGHADEFWAHALAVHAAGQPRMAIAYRGQRRQSISEMGLLP
jgi:phage FluMu gp28-like protein